jgi:hypothetical protein
MVIERTIPAGARREADREESADNLVVFLTVTHKTLTDPIRVVSDPVDHTLGGAVFTGFQFDISILTDTEDAPFAQLRIQNADRRIGEALRSLDTPPKIRLEVISGSEFDQTVDPRAEIGTAARTYVADELLLTAVDADALFVTGRLQARDYARELWPGRMATQEFFPGLFR